MAIFMKLTRLANFPKLNTQSCLVIRAATLPELS